METETELRKIIRLFLYLAIDCLMIKFYNERVIYLVFERMNCFSEKFKEGDTVLDVKNQEMNRLFNELMSGDILLGDDLQQFKKDHKVNITDMAINKIPFVKFHILSEEQNYRLFEFEHEVLKISANTNNSNEVAITCAFVDSVQPEYSVVLGTEYEINLLADPETYHLLRSPGFNKIVVNIHNHPSCSIFSVFDIMFFLTETNLRLIVLLSNKGQLFYMLKTDNYRHSECRALFMEIVEKVHPKTFQNGKFHIGSLNHDELIKISHNFLKQSIKVGIEYRAVQGGGSNA